MAKYMALLRGINVGGNKKVPMAKLKLVMEDAGYNKVWTILASGNLMFETNSTTIPSLTKKITSLLAEAFGFEIPVLLRTSAEIQNLIASDPFKGIVVTKDHRLYITFLSDSINNNLDLPYTSPDKSFTILRQENSELISMLDLAHGGTSDAMAILEKTYGKNITTRNWNTVLKLIRTED
ncbi:MAG: DUF1697 domain-containing protein [bacterium]